MAVQFRESGTILFKASGSVAMDSDCCCGGGECCTFDPARELYLTIDNFTLDGGESCDAGCDGFGVTAKANFGGAITETGPIPATWFTENCEDDAPYQIAYSMVCDGGLHYLNMFSSALSAVIDNCDDNNVLCYISLGGTGNYLIGDGVAVCDPFYIQGTLTLYIYDPDGVTLCGTGSARFTITE